MKAIQEQSLTKMKYPYGYDSRSGELVDKGPPICMQTHNICFIETNKAMQPVGVLWHSTAAFNTTLKRYVQPWGSGNTIDQAVDRNGNIIWKNTYSDKDWLSILGVNSNHNDWNHPPEGERGREAGLNCWIGTFADGTVGTVQTMPWNYKPWGCGSVGNNSCNNGWIQFEICEDDVEHNPNLSYFNSVYAEACHITAYLCKKFNINPLGFVVRNGVKIPTILCHADSHKLGFGSNHGDVNHWFPKFGKSMETVRNDVKAIMEGKDFSLSSSTAPGFTINPPTPPADGSTYPTPDPDESYTEDPVLSYENTTEILEPIEPVLINKLTVENITSTTAQVKISAGENYLDYYWSYKVKKLKNNSTVLNKKLSPSSKEITIELNNLVPNNSYSLEVFATDSFENITNSPDIIFSTAQDYPKAVGTVVFEINNFLRENTSFDIAFKHTTSWGNYSRANKGYRTTLLINGQEVGYTDNLFTVTSTTSKKLSLESFLSTFNVSKLNLTDTIQIGIQPWVKDENNSYIFAEGYPSCSKPIYLQHYLSVIDKVFLNVDNKNRRAIMYLNT